MKKIKEYKIIIIIFVVLILGILYLYKIRPIVIKQSCYKSAKEATIKREINNEAESYFNSVYKLCLLKKGL